MNKEEKINTLKNMLNCYLHATNLTNKEMEESEKFTDKLIEDICNTRCSLQLKDKKAPTFEHWLICNFEETKSGKYIDFNNGDNYRDKEVLKLKYNKIFKPTL